MISPTDDHFKLAVLRELDRIRAEGEADGCKSLPSISAGALSQRVGWDREATVEAVASLLRQNHVTGRIRLARPRDVQNLQITQQGRAVLAAAAAQITLPQAHIAVSVGGHVRAPINIAGANQVIGDAGEFPSEDKTTEREPKLLRKVNPWLTFLVSVGTLVGMIAAGILWLLGVF